MPDQPRPFSDFDAEVRLSDISALHDLVTRPINEHSLTEWASDSLSRKSLLSEVAFFSMGPNGFEQIGGYRRSPLVRRRGPVAGPAGPGRPGPRRTVTHAAQRTPAAPNLPDTPLAFRYPPLRIPRAASRARPHPGTMAPRDSTNGFVRCHSDGTDSPIITSTSDSTNVAWCKQADPVSGPGGWSSPFARGPLRPRRPPRAGRPAPAGRRPASRPGPTGWRHRR